MKSLTSEIIPRRRFGLHLSVLLAATALAGCCCQKEGRHPSPSTTGAAVVSDVKGKADFSAPSTAPSKSAENAGSASVQQSAPSDEWLTLFDGSSLAGWKASDFGGAGEVEVKNNEMILHMGALLSGVTWTNAAVLPKTNYEISLDAKKIDGNDFFCGWTFPVGESYCSLILGGWGGGVVGISSIDGLDASENDTTRYMNFEKDKWYRVRVRVTPSKLAAWIDDEPIVDQAIEGRRISMRPGEIEIAIPLAISNYQTSSALRNVKLRRLPPP